MTIEASMPQEPAYSHSIKIEDTAKGIRLSVHVYAHNTAEALEAAFSLYLNAKIKALENKIIIAPIDAK